jgi:hypothetical protein
VEYYRTREGKLKKKIQNGKRSGVEAKAVFNDCEQTGNNLVLQERRIGERMLCYLRLVISLIEGRRVSAAEILEMLVRVLRQHSIVRRRRIDYILQHLNKRPP